MPENRRHHCQRTTIPWQLAQFPPPAPGPTCQHGTMSGRQVGRIKLVPQKWHSQIVNEDVEWQDLRKANRTQKTRAAQMSLEDSLLKLGFLKGSLLANSEANAKAKARQEQKQKQKQNKKQKQR